MSSQNMLEYLYWHKDGQLHYLIGKPSVIHLACRDHAAGLYYCYGNGYQFESPWYTLNNGYGVMEILLQLHRIPEDIRATHLLLYRGDYD